MESVADKHKRLIKLIHTAKSKLFMDDDTYRALLVAETGKASIKDMANWELEKIVKRLKQSGFKVRPPRTGEVPESSGTIPVKKPAPKAKRAQADDAQSQMLRGLWLELHELGVVRDSSESALAHWVKRQTRVEALQWLDTAQASHCIEALKAWKQRHTR